MPRSLSVVLEDAVAAPLPFVFVDHDAMEGSGLKRTE